MNTMYLILFFIFGLFMGSFYTVVGIRLPRKENFILARSKCETCHHLLSLLDMIPILSYLFLRGKCHYCKAKIDSLSTYIEFFTGLLFAVSYYSFGLTWNLVLALGIVSILVIVIVSDLTYLIIPDEVLIFFSIYFIICRFFLEGIKGVIYHIGIGVFLFLVMYGIMLLGNKIFKKESMGGGDVKMMFLFGLVLDPLLGTLTIFLGSLFALPMSLVLYIKKNEKVIPFGPFLLIAFAFIFYTKMTSLDVLNFLGF